ncbi:MAG: isocitrate/isopropylmalate dehydrogenase family protein [Armatimonadetes bacterium]|nr:isocitrate/isopropylmalate dehydrogenase family protein [Armatimonadota bacterium]NOG91675.1 isocitrate/isopropylmalate dehydrogenase family protein [Armatimonadota bacterium]
MAHKACIIRGDGIGPEISDATERIIAASGVDIEWIPLDAGLKCVEAGEPIVPDRTLDKIAEVGVALKAPMTTPIGKGSVSPNVTLRKRLDLFACVRPAKSFPGVPTPFEGLDLVIFRENTEDLYAQIEYMETQAVAMSTKIISEPGTERICRSAFEYARANGRKIVTCVHKANIMKVSDGLFLRTFQRVAQDYPDIESWDVIVDALCMQLVTKWRQFDVLVLPNLYGDIVSDLAAGMMGGLGVAPGANYGTHAAVFEAVHGSAPKYTGQNKVNPMALLLSGTLMLRHLGDRKAAEDIEAAVSQTVSAGIKTYDLGGTAKTSEFADAVCSLLKG